MLKTIAIIGGNVLVLGALSINAFLAIGRGCNVGGGCTGSPSTMTWVMAIGPLLILAGILLKFSGDLRAALAARRADAATAKAQRAVVQADEDATDDQMQSRLARAMRKGDDAADDAADAGMDMDEREDAVMDAQSAPPAHDPFRAPMLTDDYAEAFAEAEGDAEARAESESDANDAADDADADTLLVDRVDPFTAPAPAAAPMTMAMPVDGGSAEIGSDADGADYAPLSAAEMPSASPTVPEWMRAPARTPATSNGPVFDPADEATGFDAADEPAADNAADADGEDPYYALNSTADAVAHPGRRHLNFGLPDAADIEADAEIEADAGADAAFDDYGAHMQADDAPLADGADDVADDDGAHGLSIATLAPPRAVVEEAPDPVDGLDLFLAPRRAGDMRLRAGSQSGFPWVVAGLDSMARAMAAHISPDRLGDYAAETSAWQQLAASLPADCPVGGADADSFTTWLNNVTDYVSATGDAAAMRAAVADTLLELRRLARSDDGLRAALPASIAH
ncbi:MAG: hypothetical protein ACKOUM_02990 [Sphingopyxis sp.]